MLKKLIINADDFNLTAACDLAIYDAYNAGAITSASFMVWPDGGQPMLASSVPCGVHLRLTDGHPLSAPGLIPSLVENNGAFPASRNRVAAKEVNSDEVLIEWRAQIEAFRRMGLSPTHLDSHHHVHDISEVWEPYRNLCAMYGVAGVPLSWAQREYLRAWAIPTADYTEIRWTDGKLATLLSLLSEACADHGVVQLMTHPGFLDEDLLRASSMTDVRVAEFRVLCSAALADWLASHGVQRAGIEALRQRPGEIAKIDILYCAWNRRDYTVASLDALLANTDWSRVRNLWLYDDGSTDGTMAVLEAVFEDFRGSHRMAGVSVQVARPPEHPIGPVAVMREFLENREPLPWFAKIDNDVVVPPGWLPACLEILRRQPEVDLLGLEAVYPPNGRVVGAGVGRTSVWAMPESAVACGHIGGIGLMRTAAFTELPVADGRLGFTEWQIKHPVNKAWLLPGLPVILLDRLPFDPWASLGAHYEELGWQRPWQRYTTNDAGLWDWWAKL